MDFKHMGEPFGFFEHAYRGESERYENYQRELDLAKLFEVSPSEPRAGRI